MKSDSLSFSLTSHSQEKKGSCLNKLPVRDSNFFVIKWNYANPVVHNLLMIQ